MTTVVGEGFHRMEKKKNSAIGRGQTGLQNQPGTLIK